MPTSTVENYVKTLYSERQRAGSELVGLGRLATAMNVVPGTVTTMVRTLADAGLVRYEPRVGVALTAAGETLALHVLRRHRLVESFLVEVLKFDWSEVHDEAEELEHAISEKLLEKIDAYLGHPTVDPHGDPIPTAAGEINRRQLLSLIECHPGERVKLCRVENQDTAFLTYVNDRGLRLGSEFVVKEVDAIADVITLQKDDGSTVALGSTAANAMYVSR